MQQIQLRITTASRVLAQLRARQAVKRELQAQFTAIGEALKAKVET